MNPPRTPTEGSEAEPLESQSSDRQLGRQTVVPGAGDVVELPGSEGEHLEQERLGTAARAKAFYDTQMLDHLNASMREFVRQQTLLFIATSDSRGECDCSLRAGPPGFVQVLDERTLALPEYHGNGVMASMGNILENPHIGMIFVDFFRTTVGLHVNGFARVASNEHMLAHSSATEELIQATHASDGRRPERWILAQVQEAYMHCSKHIPLLKQLDKTRHWGSDEALHKGGDFFHAKDSERPWVDGERRR